MIFLRLHTKRKTAKARAALVFFSLLLNLVSPLAVLAAITPQINYQGKLTDSTGVAVATGNYNFTFRLYSAASGGSPLWSEVRSGGNRVNVRNGLFSVMLGEVTAFTGIDFNQPLYLTVEVGGTAVSPAWDGEMSPRKILGAVPAALTSDTLDSLDSSQFIRSDVAGVLTAASTSAALTINQIGAGSIFNLKNNNTSVFEVLASGLASTSALSVATDATIGGDLTVNGGITLGGVFRSSWPSGGGGDSGFWATSTDGLIGYPTLPNGYAIVIGGGATTTNNVKFQVTGNAAITGQLSALGSLIVGANSSGTSLSTGDVLADRLRFNSTSSVYASDNDLIFEDGNAGIKTLSDLVFSQTTCGQTNTVLSGGLATYSGTDFVYDVPTTSYCINGLQYTTTASQVTLDDADSQGDRIDVIAVDNTGSVVVLTGSTSTNPIAPAIDPASQLDLTFIYVKAGAVAPGIDGTGPRQESMYLNNAEWVGTQSFPNGGVVDFNNTTDPQAGSKNVEVTTALHYGGYLQFATSTAVWDPTGYNYFSFYIKNKVAWASASDQLNITFRNNSGNQLGSLVAIRHNTYGFDKNNTSAYQKITIPLASFGSLGTSIKYVRFTTMPASHSATFNFRLDGIMAQGPSIPSGSTPTTGLTGNGLASQLTFWTGTSTLAGNNSLIWNNTTGRLGIGTSSPIALLSVGGNAAFGGNITATGTITSTSVSTSTFAGSLSVAGSSGLTVLSSGEVGIGTTNPQSKLEVNGTVRSSLFSLSSSLYFGSAESNRAVISVTNNGNYIGGDNTGSTYLAYGGSYSGGGDWYATANNPFHLGVSSSGVTLFSNSTTANATFTPTAIDRFDRSGNLGLGNISPEFRLDVTGAGRFSTFVDAANFVATSSVDVSSFAGKVGIGTTSPSNKLEVNGSAYLSGNLTAANITATGTLNVSGQTTIATASSSALTVSSSGGFTIGTLTGPLSASNGLVSATTSVAVIYGGTGLSSYTGGDLLYANSATSLAALHDVAVGNVLLSGGTGAAPAWGKVSLTAAISGILPIANGGTNASSFAANTLTYFDGTRLMSTSSPVVGYITATTSTATSTFTGGLTAGGAGFIIGQDGRAGFGTSPTSTFQVSISGSATTSVTAPASCSVSFTQDDAGTYSDNDQISYRVYTKYDSNVGPYSATYASCSGTAPNMGGTTYRAEVVISSVSGAYGFKIFRDYNGAGFANNNEVQTKTSSAGPTTTFIDMGYGWSSGDISTPTSAVLPSSLALSVTGQSVFNGLVGIGSSTPAYTFGVAGNIGATNIYARSIDLSDSFTFRGVFHNSWPNNLYGSTTSSGLAQGAHGGTTALGWNSLAVETTAYRNTAIGEAALNRTTIGHSNTAIGWYSMLNNSTGHDNTALGVGSLLGIGTAFTSASSTGSYNSVIGVDAAEQNTTGDGNSILGMKALRYNTTGSYNVAIGHYAGLGGAGDLTSQNSVIDNNMLFLGAYAARDGSIASSTALTNGSAIGYGATVACSDCLVLGGTGSYAVNVGIGSTTPRSTLSISGRGTTTPFTVASSTGATMLTVLANGNVGVGESDPQRNLQIVQSTATTSLNAGGVLSLVAANTGVTTGSINAIDFMAYKGYSSPTYYNPHAVIGTRVTDVSVGLQTAFFVAVKNGNTGTSPVEEKLTVLPNGNVGISSTTPLSTLAVSSVAGTNPFTIASSTGLTMLTVLQNGNVGVGSSTPLSTLSITSRAGASPFTVASSTGLTMFTVSQNGNVGVGSSLTIGSVNTAPTWGSLLVKPRTSGYSGANIMEIDGPAGGVFYLGVQGTDTGWGGASGDTILYSSGDLRFSPGGNPAIPFVIKTTGAVGIGLAAPVGTLEIARGTVSNSGTLVIDGTTYKSHFNYSYDEDTYIRGGKINSNIHIGDVNSGNINLAVGKGNVLIGTNTSGVTLGTPISFTHTDNGSEVDYIDSSTHLTRANNNPLYNTVTEGSFNDPISPANTEWNTDGFSNLANVRTRTYGQMKPVIQGAFTSFQNIAGQELVMHIISTNSYWKVVFSSWTSGQSGGGFAYTRTQIFPQGGNLIVNNFAGISSSTPLSTLSVSGRGGITPFTVASSTGLTMLTVLQSGNVGIGTPNPSATLDVGGAINVFDGGIKTRPGGIVSEANATIVDFGMNDSRFGTQTNGDQGGFIRVDTRAGNGLFQIFGRVAGASSPSAIGVISADGLFGLGSTSPLSTVSITGSASVNPFTVASSTGLSLLTVLKSGNVGINNPNPFAKLEIRNGDIKLTNATSPNGVGVYTDNNAYLAGNQYLDMAAGTYKAASTGTSNRFTVSYSTGFQFFSGASASTNAAVTNTETMRLYPSGGLALGNNAVANNGDPGNGSMTLEGDICSDNYGCFSGFSDLRLKTDITAFASTTLAKIMALEPVYYKWNDIYLKDHSQLGATSTQIGLIAQNVQSQFPELVTLTSSGYYTLDYKKLTAVLVEGMKEQQGLIVQLASTTDSYARLSPVIHDNLLTLGRSWTIDLSSGRITLAGGLDLSNTDITSIRSLQGAASAWSLSAEGVLTVKEVHTDKLCVGGTCVTEEVLKTLLQNSNTSGSAPSETPPPPPEENTPTGSTTDSGGGEVVTPPTDNSSAGETPPPSVETTPPESSTPPATTAPSGGTGESSGEAPPAAPPPVE